MQMPIDRIVIKAGMMEYMRSNAVKCSSKQMVAHGHSAAHAGVG